MSDATSGLRNGRPAPGTARRMAGLLAVAALAAGISVLSEERGRASAAGAVLFEGRYAQDAVLEPTEMHALEFESFGS